MLRSFRSIMKKGKPQERTERCEDCFFCRPLGNGFICDIHRSQAEPSEPACFLILKKKSLTL